jgi:cellulose synthase (UDP-forming)
MKDQPPSTDDERSPLFMGLRNPLLRRAVFAIYLIEIVAYLTWRVGYTIQLENPVFSLLFLAAELHCFATSIIFYIYTFRPVLRRAGRPSQRDWSVDVFIATYNENLDIVRSTAVAARDMDGPHRTWICDDGRRLEMARLAKELGVGYITRPDNANFKSGNLNNALSKTSGDLILVLDADHIPRREQLTRMLGYMDDPRVGLVQAPQVFYNLNSFQHVPKGALNWHESLLFHHRIQNGADRYGMAFSVGSGGLNRRSALDAIGGFANGSITEDIHTTMRMHAAGFRTVYVDQPLGFLLAPETPLAYHIQRQRWAQGGLQILRKENPLTREGLSPHQRVAYLNALAWPFSYLSYLVFYLGPAVYLLLDISPITSSAAWAVPLFLAHILFGMSVFRLLASPQAQVFRAEIYRMVTLPTVLTALPRLLFPDGLKFQVTPKGTRSGIPRIMATGVMALLVLNVVGACAGIYRLGAGDPDVAGVTFTTVLSVFFVAVASAALSKLRKHGNDAVPFEIPVSISTTARSGDQPLHVEVLAMTSQRARLALDRPLSRGDRLDLDLIPIGLTGSVEAEVDRTHADPLEVGIAFQQLRPTTRDALDRFVFQTAFPAYLEGFIDTPPGPAPEPIDQGQGRVHRLPSSRQRQAAAKAKAKRAAAASQSAK